VTMATLAAPLLAILPQEAMDQHRGLRLLTPSRPLNRSQSLRIALTRQEGHLGAQVGLQDHLSLPLPLESAATEAPPTKQHSPQEAGLKVAKAA